MWAESKKTDSDFKKPISKKQKNMEPIDDSKIKIKDILLPTKTAMELSGITHVLNFSQVQDFLEKYHGSTDILKLSQVYTKDSVGLSKMLKDIYPHLNDRATKARITRIRKKLSSSESESDLESDSSVLSDEVEKI